MNATRALRRAAAIAGLALSAAAHPAQADAWLRRTRFAAVAELLGLKPQSEAPR